MKQRIYFSGVGPVDIRLAKSGRSYLTNAAHMLPFFAWVATPDLAQATWEWPKPWQPVDEAGCSIALVNDLKALEAYEARQKPHMERQFYGD